MRCTHLQSFCSLWEHPFLHVLSENRHHIMGGKWYLILTWYLWLINVLSIFSYMRIGCLIFIFCTSSVCIFCPFFSSGLFVFILLIYRSAFYIPDRNFLSVIYTNVCWHMEDFTSFSQIYQFYPLCFVFFYFFFKNPTTSLLQDHKDILINFLLKILLFCIYYLKIWCLYMV